jgi:hypothetical protein
VQQSWQTKFGERRVRHEPPTIAEALEAAACISDDPEQQIGLAASLLGAEVEEVRAVAEKAAQRAQRTLKLASVRRAEGPRAVVVERKRSGRLVRAARG